MNGKSTTPLPCHQQHYQKGNKSARYETIPSTFSTPFSNKQILIFSISLLQGGLHNRGYLRPQDEWQANNTIALSTTTLPRRQKRARYKTMPSTFSTPFSHTQILIFSISSLQGSPYNWGYLHPQNE
jgi:hypothetical protein